MLAIGNCTLDMAPRVVVAIRDDVGEQEVAAAIAGGADILEVRADLFSSVEGRYVSDWLECLPPCPRIGTVRSSEERGGWRDTEAQRLALFQRIMAAVDAVDIEINARAINREVIRSAREAGITVIGSFHDFDATPSLEMLRDIVSSGSALGVDIVKIAAWCATRDDLRTLAQLLVCESSTPLIVLGMGVAGQASRILFPALGSRLTYTFLGAPSAPGQFGLADTARLLRELVPLPEVPSFES